MPGSRLAQSPKGYDSDKGPKECEDKWQEEYDLGNFDGYKDDELGQHYSGGSRLGHATWLKMYKDEDLKVPTADIVFEGLNTHISLRGPPSYLKKKTKEDEHPE